MHFFSDEWVRERTRRHRTTVTRWRQANRFPPEIVRLAELELDGKLGLIHTQWEGWRIDTRSGYLTAPGGETYRPGELLAIGIRHQQLGELKRYQANARGTERDPSRPIRAILLRALRRAIGRGPRKKARAR